MLSSKPSSRSAMVTSAMAQNTHAIWSRKVPEPTSSGANPPGQREPSRRSPRVRRRDAPAGCGTSIARVPHSPRLAGMARERGAPPASKATGSPDRKPSTRRSSSARSIEVLDASGDSGVTAEDILLSTVDPLPSTISVTIVLMSLVVWLAISTLTLQGGGPAPELMMNARQREAIGPLLNRIVAGWCRSWFPIQAPSSRRFAQAFAASLKAAGLESIRPLGRYH